MKSAHTATLHYRNFGWLGGAPSAFRLAAVPDDSG